jgi:hypothetical protein
MQNEKSASGSTIKNRESRRWLHCARAINEKVTSNIGTATVIDHRCEPICHNERTLIVIGTSTFSTTTLIDLPTNKEAIIALWIMEKSEMLKSAIDLFKFNM